MSAFTGAALRAGRAGRGLLPTGQLLTPEVWARRHHSVLGVLNPTGVFNHPAAMRSPLKWSLIHGGFVLAASVAYLVNWRLSERQAVEISRLVSRLEGLARTDPLTGVPNRRVWEEELPRELERARRMGTELCVAMIDLDNFKAYNDRHGHQAGDLVLKEAASAWRAEMRSTDLLARADQVLYLAKAEGRNRHVLAS